MLRVAIKSLQLDSLKEQNIDALSTNDFFPSSTLKSFKPFFTLQVGEKSTKYKLPQFLIEKQNNMVAHGITKTSSNITWFILAPFWNYWNCPTWEVKNIYFQPGRNINNTWCINISKDSWHVSWQCCSSNWNQKFGKMSAALINEFVQRVWTLEHPKWCPNPSGPCWYQNNNFPKKY